MTERREILKGGSLSKTFKVTSQKGKIFVRKEINHKKDREYGFVRWYSQVKKHQRLLALEPNLFPEIYSFEISKEFSAIDIEWLQGYVDLKSYLTEGKVSDYEIKFIADELKQSLDKIHKNKLVGIGNAGLLYFREEVFQKLTDAINISKEFKEFLNFPYYIYLGRKVGNMYHKLDELKGFFSKLELDEEFILGNPTLENIMYHPLRRKLKFIDLYEESMIDTKYLDYSMILQCSTSYYGFINDRKVSVNKYYVSHDLSVPITLELFSKSFKRFLPENSMHIIKIFELTQFLRMLPFKLLAGETVKAKFFYAHACSLYSEIF